MIHRTDKFAHTVFPIINVPCAYLVLKPLRCGTYWKRHLKKGGAYFKVRRFVQMKLRKFFIIHSFGITTNNYHYLILYTRFFINYIFISNARLKLATNQVKAKQHPEAELLLSETYSLCSSTLSSKNDKKIF